MTLRDVINHPRAPGYIFEIQSFSHVYQRSIYSLRYDRHIASAILSIYPKYNNINHVTISRISFSLNLINIMIVFFFFSPSSYQQMISNYFSVHRMCDRKLSIVYRTVQSTLIARLPLKDDKMTFFSAVRSRFNK